MNVNLSLCIILNRQIDLSLLFEAMGLLAVSITVNAMHAAPEEAAAREREFIPSALKCRVFRAQNGAALEEFGRQSAIMGRELIFAKQGPERILSLSGLIPLPMGDDFVAAARLAQSDDEISIAEQFAYYTTPDVSCILRSVGNENPNFEFFRRLGR